MQVDHKYLEKFAVPIGGEPEEVALNGFEQFANAAKGIDDEHGTYLAVLHRDAYSEDERWDIQPGTAKRETFVIIKRAGETVGTVGYRFPGLVQLDDLRAWYRDKVDLVDPAPEPEPTAPETLN